jgi:hypothetical protein
MNYSEYIKSPAWKSKADKAKKAAGYRCQICNRGRDEGATLDAHHRTYDRLGNEAPGDVTVLCHECHELYEKNKKGLLGEGIAPNYFKDLVTLLTKTIFERDKALYKKHTGKDWRSAK